MPNSCLTIRAVILVLGCAAYATRALDSNSNQQSDIWEAFYNAHNLPPGGDADLDGFSNFIECISGTNPFDPASFPRLGIIHGPDDGLSLHWSSQPGKSYGILGSPDLNPANFTLIGTAYGDGAEMLRELSANGQDRWFFKLEALDLDSDSDGLTDWEENAIGFNPFLNHSDRHDTADLARVQSTLNMASIITAGTHKASSIRVAPRLSRAVTASGSSTVSRGDSTLITPASPSARHTSTRRASRLDKRCTR